LGTDTITHRDGVVVMPLSDAHPPITRERMYKTANLRKWVVIGIPPFPSPCRLPKNIGSISKVKF
jgi:hypothetical protein